jgi:hypothetical protein
MKRYEAGGRRRGGGGWGGVGGLYVTVTEPSASARTRGLSELEGQYTLQSCGGARKTAFSMKGSSSALQTLYNSVILHALQQSSAQNAKERRTEDAQTSCEGEERR